MHPYHHVRTEDGRESLTVFMPSGVPVVATGDHPHFAELLEGAQSDMPAEELRDLSDLSNAVAARFDTLSERISVANGRVYFDGDEVNSTITQQIKRCLDDPNVGDWKPLVLFMENVAANPNPHSREQLFDWLRDREFTITNNGCFIAYKGVTADEDDNYVSCSSGSGVVDGEQHEGRLPNHVGATVEMPRSDVQHDPTKGCHTGLHVGTYKYAEGFNRAALLTVLVNPRDVVSVPTDCNAEKMRVCRYVVSDDEPKPPSESAAIEEVEEKIYKYRGEEYVESGEFRIPELGDIYLSQYSGTFGMVLQAASNHAMFSRASSQPILERVRPEIAGEVIESKGKVYVVTGEGSPRKGDLYYNIFDGAFVAKFDHNSVSAAAKMLREIEHGDYNAETDQYWMACPGKKVSWAPARGRSQEEFLDEHEKCFA